MSLSGCSEAALECGRRLGICGHPKTIRRFRKSLASNNKPQVNDFVSEALEKHQFSIVVIDDFHSVHTIPRPTSSLTSKALHMATSIIDVHPPIQSIPLQRGTSPHFWPSDDTCRGLINIDRLAEYIVEQLPSFFQSTWLESLPPSFKRLETRDINTSLENQRYGTCDIYVFSLLII